MTDSMNALTESVGIRLDRTEKAVARLVDAVEKQSQNIDSNTAAIERLERAVSSLVTGINAQKETMQQMMTQQSEFLKLATLQAQIIRDQKVA